MDNEPLIALPFETQLEEHILSCFIYEPACIAEAIEIIRPAFFFHGGHAKVCKRIFDLWSEDERSVDLAALAPTFEKASIPLARMVEAVRAISTTDNIEQHCERLRDIAALRAAIRIGMDLGQKAHLRDRDEIRDAIATAEGKISRVTDMTIRSDTLVSMKDAVMQFHERFELIVNGGGGGITGLPTGLEDLDAITSGLQDSDLVVIGARPSMGKTTFMMQLALNMSLPKGDDPGAPGAIFSLEQSRDQLVMRATANIARIDMEALKSGLMIEDSWHRYTMATSQLSRANFIIDDQSKLSVPEIKAKARKIKRELGGLRYILIDYLGKLRGNGTSNRYDEVSENIRSLKDLAKDFGVPVIVLAQLSRKVEERQDKRPMMSDLRDSGEIEQEADIIGFLYRDDYYDKESSKKNIVELIIAKHRNGRTGSVEFGFLKQYNRIVPLDRGGKKDAPEQMALL